MPRRIEPQFIGRVVGVQRQLADEGFVVAAKGPRPEVRRGGSVLMVGAALFVVGVSMAIRLFRSYNQSMREARAKAPAAADGGTVERRSP